MRAFEDDSTIQVVRVKYGHPIGRGPEAIAIGTLDTEAFNKSKAMELPRNIVIGHDALLSVGEVCQALKLGKKALIVADENTIKIAGKTVEKELTGRKIRYSEFLIPDATWEEVRDGEERIRKGAFEFAIGVGGGRSIDVAKCASFNAGVPFVSVPTAASHDGVVSSRASIQKDGEKASIGAQTPIAVIMDTGVIAESPFRLLASGCGDIISNLAAVKDWALARNLRNEYYSSYAAALSELAARLLIEAQVLPRPRQAREEARPPRGAVRRGHDHDDVPPWRELGGGPERAPR